LLGKRCGAVQRAVGGLPPGAALLFSKAREPQS